NVETNKGIEETMGLSSVKDSRATEEQQTKRWLEAIGRTDEYISDPTLYYTNSIVHNNNENPITYPLNITFSKLGGNMAACFARGVSFYEEKEKDFPDPNLG
ncbi:5560_t:CDS:2, partial [Ambispora leptoticha]